MDIAKIKEEHGSHYPKSHLINQLIIKVEELEAECKERVAEKMEWLGERGALMDDLIQITKDRDHERFHREAAEAENERLQSSLTLSREEGRREGMERAAVIVETLAIKLPPSSRGNVAVQTAAAIRSEAKGGRK